MVSPLQTVAYSLQLISTILPVIEKISVKFCV
jgi:hypothetical protein